MTRPRTLAVLGTALVASLAASAAAADAAVTSASINGPTATLNLDGLDDTVTVTAAGGVLVHGQTTGGLATGSDWDSATGGEQTIPAAAATNVVINAGDGSDAVTVLAKTTELGSATLNGDGGDDVLTGADTADALNGGDGNDRLVGARGPDTMSGALGNDTLVWNNGDNSDTMTGDGGNDGIEVNGAANAGDAFTLEPTGDRVRFQRTNLITFTLDTQAERFQVNGLGGNDGVSAGNVGALTLLDVDGGAGNDIVNGSDGPDLLRGGEGNDALNGGGGDDRIVGDRGGDTMTGGAGDDTAVWNNGDGSDVINGEDGRDDVEVNGALSGAGDVLTVQPNAARVKFDRTNLVPFSLDIGTSETMHANGHGGDDTITVGNVGGFTVTAAGGSGNDTLTGGDAAEMFLGGSGNDTITPGGGLDVVSADDGDDRVDVRDLRSDVALGGAGNDTVAADADVLDVLDGFEAITRAPAAKAAKVTIASAVKVNRRTGRASIKLRCPAGSAAKCAGTLTLMTAGSVKVGGVRAVLQLGRARYDVPAGKSRTLSVKLAPGTRRIASKKTGRVRVLAVAATGASGSIVSGTKRLTLSMGKR